MIFDTKEETHLEQIANQPGVPVKEKSLRFVARMLLKLAREIERREEFNSELRAGDDW